MPSLLNQLLVLLVLLPLVPVLANLLLLPQPLAAPILPLCVGTSDSGSSLIYFKDLLSSRRFLVDSRASVSVFPAPPSASGSGLQLVTADGSTCSGSRIIPLCFGSHRFDCLF